MRTHWLSKRNLWAVFSVIFICGCTMVRSYAVKERGIYVTLETSDFNIAASFELPASATIQKREFGINETPEAVIVGYEGCSVTEELIALSTGETIFKKEIYIGPNRYHWNRLEIDRAGDYRLRLLFNGKEHDSVRFSVVR